MIDQAIIKLLTATGHMTHPFGNPSPWPTTTLGEDTEATQLAIHSYQDFTSPTLDALCLKHHGRPLQCDGEYGPATRELMAQPRCGCRDYGPNVQAATGDGSWSGCHGIGDYHAATVYIDKSNMPSFLEDDFEEIWDNTVQAYDAIGLRWLRTMERSHAVNTIVSWETGRGWIGLAIVGQRQSCTSDIWAKFDKGYRPGNLVRMWSGLFCHELGHNAGLSHTRGGIMNPYLLSLPASWEDDPSLPILTRKYGGKPVGGGDRDQYWTQQTFRSPSGREVVTALNPPIKIDEDK